MKKPVVASAFFIFFLVTALTFVSYQATLPFISPPLPFEIRRFNHYSGVTHVHSQLSNGSGSIENIAKAAAIAQCDFVFVTDLNQTSPSPWEEGYQDGVLILKGQEFGHLNGHILAYGFSETEFLSGLGQTQMKIDDLLQQPRKVRGGGILIAAHPLLEHLQWQEPNLPGLDGMEILNADSLWRKKWKEAWPSALWSFLLLPFNPDLAFVRLFIDPTEELSLWTEQLSKRGFLGLAGSDAKANLTLYTGMKIKFPSYARMFRLFKNHVWLKSELTGDVRSDRKKILSALTSGQFFIAFDLLGDPKGFEFFGTQKRIDHLPGVTLSMSQGPVKLFTDLGRDLEIPHEINLYRNNQRIATSNQRKVEWSVTEPGAYRVVVRVIPSLPIPDGKVWFSWVYSNAIRVEP
ncbi:MAG: hypothetical protein IT289_09725 [Oligoflexia bacterium]|nr:hypothetical protein [Oligoflexia bacterium]